MELSDSIVKAFNELSDKQSLEMVEGFSCRYNVMDTSHANFEFILALRIVERYMSYTQNLTQALQAKAVDIIQAVEHVRTLKNVLSDAHSHVDIQFHAMYERASRQAQIYNLAPQSPQRCVRQGG